MRLKYRKNATEYVHSMLNCNNIERIIENHWGLIENSCGSLFSAGSGQNYHIRQVGIMKPTRHFGGGCWYPLVNI